MATSDPSHDHELNTKPVESDPVDDDWRTIEIDNLAWDKQRKCWMQCPGVVVTTGDTVYDKVNYQPHMIVGIDKSDADMKPLCEGGTVPIYRASIRVADDPRWRDHTDFTLNLADALKRLREKVDRLSHKLAAAQEEHDRILRLVRHARQIAGQGR